MGDNKEIANALKYDKNKDSAPKLIAKGAGVTAKKIKEIAKDNNIPIYKDKKLSKQLFNLSIGDKIPQELYEIVAEILVFIAKLDKNGEEIYNG